MHKQENLLNGPQKEKISREHSRQTKKSKKSKRKIATKICIILSIISIICLILGIVLKNPYIIIIGILPAAIYETWRTTGFYSKSASVGIFALSVLSVLTLLDYLKFSLIGGAENQKNIYLQGYYLPLGDAKFVLPAAIFLLAIILFLRTYGKYTKWLSVIILGNSIGLIYLVNKDALIEILTNII